MTLITKIDIDSFIIRIFFLSILAMFEYSPVIKIEIIKFVLSELEFKSFISESPQHLIKSNSFK